MNGPAPALSDEQLVAYARGAGFFGEALTTMVAIIMGESGADPDNVGDEGLVTQKWGPSIGLAQIRSLWGDRGTGRTRDPDRLTDPAFNLRSAFAISSGGTNFRDWSVFTNGRYRDYLDEARAAVAGTGSTGGGGGRVGLIGGGGGGGLVDKVTEPLLGGLARIALVGTLVAGGLALIAAGGWKAVSR